MLKSTGTCATNQYIRQINADGSVVCANVPYHWGVICSAGEYIERINADGTPICRSLQEVLINKMCPEGLSLRGFDSTGGVICHNTEYTNIMLTDYFLSASNQIKTLALGPHKFCALSSDYPASFNSHCLISRNGNNWSLVVSSDTAGQTQACGAICFD